MSRTMPRKTKDARPGRVTPKGGPPKRRAATSAPAAGAAAVGRGGGGGGAGGRGGGRAGAGESGRYTAPIPRELRASPWWVPALMIAFFGIGVLVILLNYLSLLGGSASNVYLFVGLGLIVAGFITSTRWH
jgi:hypothetical protein